MIVIGPIIFGFLIGFIVGTRFKTSSKTNINLTASAIILLLLFTVLIAWQLGQFPYYNDLPMATGFISAFIGLIIGNLIFNR